MWPSRRSVNDICELCDLAIEQCYPRWLWTKHSHASSHWVYHHQAKLGRTFLERETQREEFTERNTVFHLWAHDWQFLGTGWLSMSQVSNSLGWLVMCHKAGQREHASLVLPGSTLETCRALLCLPLACHTQQPGSFFIADMEGFVVVVVFCGFQAPSCCQCWLFSSH